jgi:hypothetical protein
MSKRFATTLILFAGLCAIGAAADDDKKGPPWKHGFSFQVRPAGGLDFNEQTPRYGVEVFQDPVVKSLVYVLENGSVAVGSQARFSEGEGKKPEFSHAVELSIRKAGDSSWDKAKKFSSEVRRDPYADNLMYVTEAGSIAVVPANGASPPKPVKNPAWFHGMELAVRKAGEKEFTDKTKRVGIEVYKDENSGALLYMTDGGNLAAVSASGVSKPSKVDNPVWNHGFELKVRKAGEAKFGDDTRAYGIEVFKDDNAKTLIYISDAGHIAVVPAGGVSKPDKSKDPESVVGREFRVRKANEPDFNDKTQRWGAEVYKDEVAGNYVYISENGSLAVVPAK